MAMPDLETLNACLLDIKTSPNTDAPISHLCYRPDFGKRIFPDQLDLDTEHGIIGDRWKAHAWLRLENGDPDPRVQVAIISTKLLEVVWDQSNGTIYPGDSIAADIDTSATSFPVGAKIQAGSAIIEVSDVFNDGCVKWKARYGHDAYKWARGISIRRYNPRGLYCRIVKSGTVTLDDQLIRI